VEWKQDSVSSGVEFCFKWSGNRIPFQVEWKQNFVTSGVEMEFHFGVLEMKSFGVLETEFWCLLNGKFWCLGKNSFGVSETKFRFHVTRKRMFCFLVFFCAYVLTYYG
jgi:hypothetical protein